MLARAADSVLVMVDIQERLAAAMIPAARQAVIRNSRTLIQAAACLGVPVLATEQYPKGLGPTVPELIEVLPAGARPLEKTCFSCAGAESFVAALSASGRSQLVLAGLEAHVCVLQSALELRAPGREVFVVMRQRVGRTVTLVLDVSRREGVDMRDVFFELGRQQAVAGQEDLVEDVALALRSALVTKREWIRRV